MSEELDLLPKGTILANRYQLIGKLGRGGFGITYAAYDIVTKRKCAVKECFPRQYAYRQVNGKKVIPLDAGEKSKIFNHGVEKFYEEADALQSLRDIEGVVNVFDFFLENGTGYYVMEYLNGYTYKEYAKRKGGKIPWDELEPKVKEIGLVLARVHYYHFLHRDISPDNLFLLTDGQTKLIDFGNAKSVTKTNGLGLSVFLKPGYAPMEQYSSKAKQGPYTDVYSFAASIYKLTTGIKVPDAMERSQNDSYIKLEELGYSRKLSEGVDHALKLRPKDRTQTVMDFLIEIGSFDGEGNEADTHTEMGDKGKVILEIHKGKSVEEYELPQNQCIIIGRSPSYSNIIINLPYIGRKHCEVFFDELSNELYIMDYSKNGTFLSNTQNRIIRDKIINIPLNSHIILGGEECWMRIYKK